MDEKSEFIEQDAPLKNTDNAYVEVGPNGSPVLPNEDDKKTGIEEDEHDTTLDKR